jgi:signal peptidase I
MSIFQTPPSAAPKLPPAAEPAPLTPEEQIALAKKLGPDFPWTQPTETFQPPDPSRRSKGALGIGAALFMPGLGHLIAGRPWRALFWFLLIEGCNVAMLVTLLNPGWLAVSVALSIPILILQVFHWVDASICSRESKNPMLGEPILRYAAAVLLTGCGAVLNRSSYAYLHSHFVELCYSPTDSMAPTIVPGDLFLDLKNKQSIHRWDIISLIDPVDPNKSFCKRVVGLPGDTVEITPSGLLINGVLTDPPPGAGPYMPCDPDGQPLAAASPMAATGCWGNPIRLNHDEYYVLGDNSFIHSDTISWDSRFWPSDHGHQPGALPADQITGKIVAIVSPPTRWRLFTQ